MVITLKVDRGNRFTLVRSDNGSHWRDVLETRGLWGRLDRSEFEKNLTEYITGLWRDGETVLFWGSHIRDFGFYDKKELISLRKRLLEDVQSRLRELLDDDGFGAPDKRFRAAAKRLEMFKLDIKRAPNLLIGRLLTGNRKAKFQKTWKMYRSLVEDGRLMDGLVALEEVASACEPAF